MATLLEEDGEFTTEGGLYLIREAEAPELFSIWTPEAEILGSGPTVMAAIAEARLTLRQQKEAKAVAATRAAELDALVARISGGVERLASLGQQISYHPRGVARILDELRALERKVQELNQQHFSM